MNRRLALLFIVSLTFLVAATAQPVIRSSTPVLNSASYIGPELTGSGAGIAQGAYFALFGSGFGDPNSYSKATSYPLPTTEGLGGVTVDINVAGTTTHAIMLWVFYGYQINAVLPSATPIGDGTITVSYGGATSAPAPIHVVASSFGIYAANSQGTGQAAATDVSFNQNSIIHTYHPGDVAILWGTGLGAVPWDETQPPPVADLVNFATPVTVYVGNAAAPTAPSDYHGRSLYAGLDQIVFTVPAGVVGCYVPVAVKAGGVLSNFITIAVSNTGETCSDSILGQDLIDQLAAGHNVRFGWMRLEGGAGTGDFAGATFNEFTPATAKLASYGVSSGYCMATEWYAGNGLFPNDLTLPTLDAGPALVLQGATGTFQVSQSTYLPGAYFGLLQAVGSTTTRVLWSGLNFTITGAGGADVNAISTAKTMPVLGGMINNINHYEVRSRGEDLLVKWDPSAFTQPNGVATLGGLSEVLTADGNNLIILGELQCTVPVAPGQFTIPAFVLSLLPPSGTYLARPTGYLWLGQYDQPVTFTATGLDKGLVSAAEYSLKVVGLQ